MSQPCFLNDGRVGPYKFCSVRVVGLSTAGIEEIYVVDISVVVGIVFREVYFIVNKLACFFYGFAHSEVLSFVVRTVVGGFV